VYNVEGCKSRVNEIIDLIYSVEASVCVFTEVGEHGKNLRIPEYSVVYNAGLNRSGGVCVAEMCDPRGATRGATWPRGGGRTGQ
jgi:hypothetical protein